MKKRATVLIALSLYVVAFFMASSSAQVLTTVDERSLKNKIDASNTAPIVISIENDGKLSFLSNSYSLGELEKPLDEFMDTRSPDKRLITIRTASDTAFSKLVEIMKLGRKLELDDFSFSSLGDQDSPPTRLKITMDEPRGKEPRPGGMFLRVEISDNGSFSFNGVPSTKEAITARLKTIFADRTRRRVYVIGSRNIEKAVFIKPALSTKLSDILSALEVLRTAGATPIGVQIDWLKP